MATEDYLIISDGTTTATFADGAAGASNYRIDAGGWAPAVGALALSQLGGRGPYADVVEEMRLSITGSSAAACLANVAALNRLIEQAERWARGENATIVLVKYSPKGATVSTNSAPLQAAVLGRSLADQAGNQPAVHLPPDFNGPLLRNGHYVAHGTLRFLRRGAWLLAATVDGTSAAVIDPGPYPITGMTTHPNISPAKVTITGFPASLAMDVADGKPILILAQQASDLIVADTDNGALFAYTTVADAANHAHGGNVLRYTPTGTTAIGSNFIPTAGGLGVTSSARRFAFFAAVRNNSATVTFKMQIAAYTADATTFWTTRPVTIDTAHTRPRFVPLGIVTLPNPLYMFSIILAASTTAGGPTIDIDYVVVLAVDNPYARAIQLDSMSGSTTAFVNTSRVIVDPGALTALTPNAQRLDTTAGLRDYLGYYGDAFPVASGTTFQAAYMGKTLANNNQWTTATATSLTLTVNRNDARPSPE